MINASPRNNGATGAILNALQNNLAYYRDVNIKCIALSDLKLDYCTGCAVCYKTGCCFMKDDLESLSIEISQADGVILASPTYVSNITGQMKTLIDRGHFVLEQLLYGKYAMSVITYGNYGGKQAATVLNNLITYSGATLSSKILVKNAFNHNPLTDDKLNLTISKNAAKLYDDIKKQKRYVLQKIKHAVVFNVGIKPHILKHSDEYKGIIEKHWQKRGLI